MTRPGFRPPTGLLCTVMNRKQGREPLNSPPALDQIIDVIAQHRSFVLTTHQGPDGDGLGCESALAEALTLMGKRVSVVNSDPPPAHYRFLPGSDGFQTFDASKHSKLIKKADVVILMDASTPERTADMSQALSEYPGLTVVIDHHPPAGWAKVELVSTEAAATTELVHGLIARLPVDLTPTMAEALYTGLVTDTQSFTTPNTTTESHSRAAELIAAGADPARIYQAVYASWDLGRLQLLADFLSGLRTAADGQVVWGSINQSDLRRHGRPRSDVEGFVDQAFKVADSRIAVMFVEEVDGNVSVSLRSRPGVTVNHLAQALGGGGHPMASGARVTADRATAMRKVLENFGAPEDAPAADV